MNEAEMLRQRIDALEIVRQELRSRFLSTSDPDEADDLRRRINILSEDIDVLRMRLDRLRATSVIPPITAEEAARVREGLNQLDRFAREDHNTQAAIGLLQQIAAMLS